MAIISLQDDYSASYVYEASFETCCNDEVVTARFVLNRRLLRRSARYLRVLTLHTFWRFEPLYKTGNGHEDAKRISRQQQAIMET